ncbi:MAG: inorganic pyrophosphatase Ppa [Proteobacteria bacterium]|nr:inorganic pyrophosphatase Ppa [Pseudomonadota bacterium]MBU1386834.1 inorganic pyrophosphatase Ppa [Pseudomonadota bacterium]MBU1541401.1 inorganic pyrophosphatase Ppa [Pseudomonadota bacterium]MBU2480161.1 inorganic pyrophosphatase Ppa [Pseudomonadota bacterium]
MTFNKFIEIKDKLELQKFVRSSDLDKKNCVSFCGSPKKHPYEKNRVILVSDPFSEHTFYYEFNIKDILSVEEQPNITSFSGDSVSMVRIWIKKKSIALRCTPFIVDSLK